MVFTAGMYLDWSGLAFVGAALPVPFLLSMFLIPETPRWYISKSKYLRRVLDLESKVTRPYNSEHKLLISIIRCISIIKDNRFD